MPDNLTPQQMESLHSALLAAYNKNSLARLLRFKFGKSLDHIAPANAALNDIIFTVIETAEAEGWLAELIRQSHENIPGNPQLKAFVESLSLNSENAEPTQQHDGMQSLTTVVNISRSDLLRQMVDHMSLPDIQTMSFDLGIDYEQFTGGKNIKIMEIIQFFERRNRFDELVRYLQANYPHVFK